VNLGHGEKNYSDQFIPNFKLDKTSTKFAALTIIHSGLEVRMMLTLPARTKSTSLA
jgi:hypothetical protein